MESFVNAICVRAHVKSAKHHNEPSSIQILELSEMLDDVSKTTHSIKLMKKELNRPDKMKCYIGGQLKKLAIFHRYLLIGMY